MCVAVVRKIALGGSVKALGDGVQTSARSKGDTGVSKRMAKDSSRCSSSLGFFIGRPLAVVVSVGVMSVAVVRNIALGGSVKALGDGVQTSARSEGDTGVSIRIAITKVSSISLGFGIGGSLAVSYGGVGVSSIGQRGSSTGDGLVGSIDTWGRLATKGKVGVGYQLS